MEITLNGEHNFQVTIPDEKFANPYPLVVRGYAEPVKTVKLVIKGVQRGTAARYLRFGDPVARETATLRVSSTRMSFASSFVASALPRSGRGCWSAGAKKEAFSVSTGSSHSCLRRSRK